MARTSDELVTEIKISCAIPANQALLTDDRILAFCNEEIEAKVLPILQSLNQDYLVTYDTVPLVAGQSAYSIPVRALGRTLRDIKLQDADGQIRSMSLINLEEAHLFNYSSSPTSFYFMGDKVMIVPTPPTGVALDLVEYYLQRPGRLVTVSSCSRITGVATDGLTYTTFTVNQVASGFVAGAICDFIQGQSGNSTLDKDEPITNVAGTQITFGLVDSSVGVGDYIAPQYSSPVLQFPEEGFSYLVGLAGERCLRAIGDTEGAESLAKSLPEKRKYFESMIAPRISGENIKVINRNGLLRGNRSRYGRGIFYS